MESLKRISSGIVGTILEPGSKTNLIKNFLLEGSILVAHFSLWGLKIQT